MAGTRRGGTPRTKTERKARHKSLYGGESPPRGTGIFCRRLGSVIKDEAGAKADYDRLLTYAPSGVKKTLRSIRGDEAGHRKKLIKMRDRYCR